jgi:hypothetical protein
MQIVFGTQMKHASKQVNNQELKFWPREVQTTFKASFPNLKNNLL